MSRFPRTLVSLLCAWCYAPTGQCLSIEGSPPTQTEAIAAPKANWPDFGDIAEKAKEAADKAVEASEAVNKTVEGAIDQAANATKSTIDMVVHTVRSSLQHVLERADEMNKTVQEAMEGFVTQVETHPVLETYEKAAAQSVDVALALYGPLTLSLNTSINSLASILKVSGFLHLSHTMIDSLAAAMVPINETHAALNKVAHVLAGLDAKINASAGNISAEISKDLDHIDEELHTAVEKLSDIFSPKFVEAYGALVEWFHATVEGMLTGEYLKEVFANLDSLPPLVQQVATSVAAPMATLESGVHAATSKIREAVPSGAYSAMGVNLLAVVASACIGAVSL